VPAPVSLVTIHHEGAGTPSDVPRGAAGGYTYWIGATRYERLRDVWSSYATLDYNHVSLDVCLSGDRMTSPVTNNDLALVEFAVANARAAGFVVDVPLVRAHRNSPGSSTVCPGTHTMERWAEVAVACTKRTAPPPPAPTKGPTMPKIIPCAKGGYWICHADGAVYAYGQAVYHGGANTFPRPTGGLVTDMAATPSGGGYYQIDEGGGVYAFGDAHEIGHP
jgi:hypothetical protein